MITAEIKLIDIDPNGNIRVKTHYKKGIYVIQEGFTRYSFGALETPEEIQVLILADIQEHAKALIARSYIAAKNLTELNALQLWSNGKSVTATEGKFRMGNKEFTVDETSVLSQKAIAPPAP